MADIVTIPDARKWLRVGSAVLDDDIRVLVNTATEIVAGVMQRPIVGEDGWAEDAVPASIVHAIKVVTCDLYDNPGGPGLDEDALRMMVGHHCRPSFG